MHVNINYKLQILFPNPDLLTPTPILFQSTLKKFKKILIREKKLRVNPPFRINLYMC